MTTEWGRLEKLCSLPNARWCPNCGSCLCERDLMVEPGVGQVWDEEYIKLTAADCPLHGVKGRHGEFPRCYNCGAQFFTESVRDEHEGRCG